MNKNDLHNQPKAFEYLTPGERRRLTEWVKANLTPIQSFNVRHTSYGLKHIFEKNGGFYIGNGAFKGAMIECGFKVQDKTALNWVFNVSEKSIKAITNQ
ncbi:hypothetical protein BEP19_16020 [Ammoniphilus oxalaticus]|uniref:Uncharacterized protein n=1 Tax=Ammoniphilus oxalaticus TaxID=66863 RepID=A0A419SQE3_9BACL|nr:hypothetical protein [Ammoniphilus oxalaticus]RKD26710.1 hypothetical protein BEP19_16020 [Ammoniphilus oxalaticus]